MNSRLGLLSCGLLAVVAFGALGACTGVDPAPCSGSSCSNGDGNGGDGGVVATPGFEIASAASIAVIQGGTVDIEITVTRSTFDGPITASASGLPAGVIPSPLVIPSGATTAKLTLSALASAAQGPTAITLSASSADGAIHRDRTATLLVRGPAGTLDTTFGAAGKVLADIGTTGIAVQAAVIQPDGRVVVGGQSDNDFVAVRLAASGVLDGTYGANGVVTVDLKSATGVASTDTAGGMALTSSGQAVLGGYRANGGENTYGVARLTAAGALDTTFDGDGYSTPSFVPAGANSELAFGVAVQTDGRVLIAGSVTSAPAAKSSAIIARFKTNGALDDTFGIGASGFFSGHSRADSADSCESVTVAADGKILVACSADESAGGGNPLPVVLRLLPTGQPDVAFGPAQSGYSTIALTGATAHNVHRLADGRSLLTGETPDGRIFVARFQADGTVDSSFGPNGIVFVAFSGAISGARSALDAAEHLVFAAGLGNDLLVARLDAAGKLDPTFGSTGFVVTPAGAKAVGNNARVAIAADGRIVAATNLEAPSTLFAVRLWP
jgi:uncharacterized delta-60 repeat protein